MTQRNIIEFARKFTKRRYGTKNERMAQKYTDMTQRIIKSEEMRSSIDFISKLECNLLLCILSDFIMLTSIQIFSDKFGPTQM
mmetsp:Transcript_42328/g.40566  ORF Transcript_42328/g.40566 Transcript_42328/m.40566 type:complete len:83 (-) Transcript_42328:212-460(-)